MRCWLTLPGAWAQPCRREESLCERAGRRRVLGDILHSTQQALVGSCCRQAWAACTLAHDCSAAGRVTPTYMLVLALGEVWQVITRNHLCLHPEYYYVRVIPRNHLLPLGLQSVRPAKCPGTTHRSAVQAKELQPAAVVSPNEARRA